MKFENYRFLRKIKQLDGKYIEFEEKKLINLSGNDYLGISKNKDLIKEFYSKMNKENIFDYSLSSTSSRLLSGNYEVYIEFEEKVAKEYDKESCLVFNSGFEANTSIISTLFQKGSVIFSDKLNHASIYDGILKSEADYFRYKHLDYEHLEQLLIKHRKKYENVYIISESIYSMDGDKVDLKKLVELKNKYSAKLYIDEAHSFGILGEKGLGLCEKENLINEVDYILCTLGKGFSSFGAFLLSNNETRECLVNKARGLIFTTALPPVILKWNSFIFDRILNMREERKYLKELSEYTNKKLKENSFEILSNSQIIPILIGETEKTEKLSKYLINNGFFILGIKPPTVPKNTSRLRLSLNPLIKFSDIDKLMKLIGEFK